MDQRIVSAIQRQRMLRILYDGQWRDFEPYVYGQLASGRDVLFGWQASEAYAGWRVLYLHRLERFLVTQKTFKVLDREYEPVRPTGFDALYAEPARVGGV
jgi:hypothetical protein